MPSLSEAIASCDCTLFSPLAECAILVTLYGRALSHYHVYTVEQFYGNTTQDFWARHEWINQNLKGRIEAFTLNYPTVSVFSDPMLLLTYMVLQTTTLYLYKIMEPLAIDESCVDMVLEYQKHAITAAREIARLTKEHAHIGYFKVRFLEAELFVLLS